MCVRCREIDGLVRVNSLVAGSGAGCRQGAVQHAREGSAVIDAVTADAGSLNHAMLRYQGPGEHAEACAAYIRAGVTAGAAVLVAATGQHLAALRIHLGGIVDRVRLADLTASGAGPGRVLSVIRMFALEHAGQPVRFVQDVGWPVRSREDLTEAIRYERLLGKALAGSTADVLCGYDVEIDADMLAAAGHWHQVVLPHNKLHAAAPGRSLAGQAVAGEDPTGRELSSPPPGAKTLTFREDQVAVREFAAAEARRAGLPPERVVDLVIAIGELAGNTLRHTAGRGVLTVWSTDDEVVCQVRDAGRIADPLAGTLRPDASSRNSRRGLWLVHQVSDLVQVRSGSAGTTIRVHLRLGQSGSRPAASPRLSTGEPHVS
jgi:anti-sigma regulatory factor (Ser/Thr protein kinase)